VVVPLTAGSFNVTLTSNTELEVRKTIMDEGPSPGSAVKHCRWWMLVAIVMLTLA
jgi:hypothetical protein